MEAKLKAKELVGKIEDAIRDNTEATHMDSVVEDTFKAAKAVALIAVETHIYNENDSPFPTMASWIENGKYWQQVKEEIPKLRP